MKEQSEDNHDEFDVKQLENELSPEMKELLEMLENDPEFSGQLETIIAAIKEGNFDLSKVQSKLTLLVESAMQKLYVKQNVKKMLEELDAGKQSIMRNLKALSLYLMMQQSSVAREAMKGLQGPKDKNAILNSEMSKQLKATIKRFAVYEIYKFVNPRRIAGETKKENFMSNVIGKGLRVAMKYEGGSIEEIKSYGPQLLKDLAKKRKQFTGKGLM